MPYGRTPVTLTCIDCAAAFTCTKRQAFHRYTYWNRGPFCPACSVNHRAGSKKGCAPTRGMTGKSHSPEAREKIRAGHLRRKALGIPHHNKGRVATEETRARLHAAYVKRAGRPPLTPEERRIVFNMQQLSKVRAYRRTPIGQLRNRLGPMLRNAIKKMGEGYQPRGAFRLLGYTAQDLANYIAARLYHHGFHCPMCNESLGAGFDVDHIIPIRTAGSTAEVIRLFALENLDVLCPRCNRVVKRGKLPQELAA